MREKVKEVLYPFLDSVDSSDPPIVDHMEASVRKLNSSCLFFSTIALWTGVADQSNAIFRSDKGCTGTSTAVSDVPSESTLLNKAQYYIQGM
jgi:hypothetical protein